MAKSIGAIIRELRCARNLTQEQLAENLGITAQAISKWENNIGMPDISQVVPIAHFFGVSTDVLFGVAADTTFDEVQYIIDTATAKESYIDEYTLLKEALRTYLQKLKTATINTILKISFSRQIRLLLMHNGQKLFVIKSLIQSYVAKLNLQQIQELSL